MKVTRFRSVSLNAPYTVPESVEEYNELAPDRTDENACLEDAIGSQAYRGMHPKFRDELVKKLEADFGIKREVVKTLTLKSTNEDGSPKTRELLEEPGAFIRRVREAKGLEAAEDWEDKYQPWADEFAPTIEFDPNQKPAQASVRIPKGALELAEKRIEEGKADGLAAKLAEWLGRSVGTTKEELALAIAEDKRRRAKLADQEYV
jgi:hypothetical protein